MTIATQMTMVALDPAALVMEDEALLEVGAQQGVNMVHSKI